MATNRDEFLVELYTGINVMLNDGYQQVPFLEFKTRMQHVETEDIRRQVLALREIINADT